MTSQERELHLVGRQVTQVCFDHAVTLRMRQMDGEATIRISGRFAMEYGGTSFDVDPDKQDNVAAALAVLHATVSEARATPEGKLELRFGDAIWLRVPADPAFEAWEVIDPDGRRVISTPGGEVVVIGGGWSS